MELKTPLKMSVPEGDNAFVPDIKIVDADGDILLSWLGSRERAEDFFTELVRRANAHDAMVAVLRGYEELEAKIVMTNECWEPNGMAQFPRLTQEIYDLAMELQSKRNAALAAAKGGGA